MPVTKLVLRLQSDQTLDDPQVGTRLRLKDLTATRAINLVWSEPAASDRDLTFRDPGANDFIVYENLNQTLANKTLTTPTISDFTNAQHTHADAANAGTVSHAVLDDLTTGDPHTQYPLLAGRPLGQTLIGGTQATEALILQSTAHATRGYVISMDSIMLFGGSEVLGLPWVPSDPLAAASKAYVDATVAGGAIWKEVLLTASQLDNTNKAIAQAQPFFIATNPAQLGDALFITDGVTLETWVFGAVSAPFQPATGATPLASMTDLVARINADSTTWSAVLVNTLVDINPTGNVVVIYRSVPAAITTDRIYGTFALANAYCVIYNIDPDYRSNTVLELPPIDLFAPGFGIGRVTADLTSTEAHAVRAESRVYLWNETGAWERVANYADLPALVEQKYLEFGVYKIVSVSGVYADTYEDLSTDFTVWDRVTSTVSSGRADIIYEGRLSATQTSLTSIKIPVKNGSIGTAQYRIFVYTEPNGLVDQYPANPGVQNAPGARTVTTIPTVSTDPTGEKRFYIVVEAYVDAGETLYVGRPFVTQS